VVFGTPVSLRGTAAVDGMIGCLSNLLPLRLALSRGTSFRALTDAAKAEVLGALEHRAVPYSALVRMTRLEADAGAAPLCDVPPLCDVAMVVDDMRWEPFSLPGITAERIYAPPGRAKFAVHLTLVAGDDGGYAGFWDYDADVYHAATMALAASQFTRLLARCTAAPDEPLGQVLASAAEASSD
jgi:non-ribosomal peptide synthetase component F